MKKKPLCSLLRLKRKVETQLEYSRRMDEKYKEFKKEVEIIINRLSIDNDLNTPDFLLAEYLFRCLNAYSVISFQIDEFKIKHEESL